MHWQESVTFTEATGTSPLDVTGYVYNSSEEGGNFVIAEIFFTGSVTPEEKQYYSSKYFVYNRLRNTLCADDDNGQISLHDYRVNIQLRT